MKQLFYIKTETAGDRQQVLSIRLGEKHFCFAISNKAATIIYRLVYISIDQWTENEWNHLFKTYPELNNAYYEVLVSFDFHSSVLVPLNDVQQNDTEVLIQTMFGLNGQSSFISESLTGWQLTNIYAVPETLKDWISTKFPVARYWHQYTLGVKNSILSCTGGMLLVDFRNDEFIVIATGRNHILLTQTFEYRNPEDVLFYLLKICDQFELSSDEVQINLSGLVDKDSSLFNELFQYFINIEFRDAIWNTGPDYPAHFFTSLNDLAKCVS